MRFNAKLTLVLLIIVRDFRRARLLLSVINEIFIVPKGR